MTRKIRLYRTGTAIGNGRLKKGFRARLRYDGHLATAHHNRRLRAAGALLQGWLPAQPGPAESAAAAHPQGALGFRIGQAVAVIVEKRRLIIEPQWKG
ncbi:hypothetical protein ABW09_11915 [Pluralibacter gergoviae]|nr:hypothetical protein ABW09_11915 [Pluralibacter gergoviae]